MARGGKREGAGRPPAGGEVRRLLNEAQGLIHQVDLEVSRLVRNGPVDAQRIEGAALDVAKQAMRASRRLRKASRRVAKGTT